VCFKVVHGLAPASLNLRCVEVSEPPDHQLTSHWCAGDQGSNLVTAALPKHIRDVESILAFKCLLNSWLCSEAFEGKLWLGQGYLDFGTIYKTLLYCMYMYDDLHFHLICERYIGV
jgi:hypothetical protein